MKFNRFFSNNRFEEQELLNLLAKQGGRVPIPIFISTGLVAALVSEHIETIYWLSWMVLIVVVFSLRYLILGWMLNKSNLSFNTCITIAIILSLTSGVTHALALCYFPSLPEFKRAIVSMILMSLTTGAIATTVGYMPIYLSYTFTVMIPMSLIWIISPGIENAGWIQVSIGLAIIMFLVLLISIARDYFKLFCDSLEIRSQQIKLNEQLQAALEEAESASRSKTRFLAAASHDLRQPLHTLSLFGAALSLVPLEPSSREIANHMDKALRSLTSQLDTLLDISKLDAGVIKVELKKLNLTVFLQRLFEDFLPLAQKKDLKLTLECQGEIFVKIDPVLFERIIRNLLSNAIKFTDHGSVGIKVIAKEEQIRIAVFDTGRGIPQSCQEKVFEEFYQLENPQRDRAQGLGLGLSIVRRLADMLQLNMQMQSSETQGTCFSFSLLKIQKAIEISKDQDSYTVNWNGLQVLVIDDEIEVSLGMKTLLESMDCQVFITQDTKGSVAALQQITPDIVLSDLRLKDGDNGLKAIRAIREVHPDMAAVLISGDTSANKLKQVKESGIELLHKPVPVDLLTQVISQLLPEDKLLKGSRVLQNARLGTLDNTT